MIQDFIGIFTRNWGLKLLSLILAIVIYYLLQPATDENESFYRPFKYSSGATDANDGTAVHINATDTVKREEPKKINNVRK